MTTTPLELARVLGYEPPPLEWPVTSVPPIPMTRFGKDHWSTFAYVETRTIDYKGVLNHDHMRCDASRHPILANAGKVTRAMGYGGCGGRYPTFLRDGQKQPDHDDYDCLDDLVAAGLLTVAMPDPPAGVLVTGLIEKELAALAVWRLTDRGRDVASALRGHKADGGNYAGFRPPGVRARAQ